MIIMKEKIVIPLTDQEVESLQKGELVKVTAPHDIVLVLASVYGEGYNSLADGVKTINDMPNILARDPVEMASRGLRGNWL